MRTCKKLGIKTVAVYSQPDVESLHTSMADEAYPIGAGPPADSYLNITRIVKAAKKAKVDGVHPGYGFLAENPDFARECEEEHLVFIGPPARILGKIANKLDSKSEAISAGVRPVLGPRHQIPTLENAEVEAARLGYPVLLKAVFGGGGRGMRIVPRRSEMKKSFEIASSEAKTAFGRAELYMEKYLENPRHIEVQVLAGRRGRRIHLGERECSIQRRYQKILEETPSPILTNGKRQELVSKALKLAGATQYENAGTFEFVMSKGGEFYYLETNKRIQVEHLVTEMVTGVDIVEEQLRIASGDGLNLSQDEIAFHGTAINCRINAEDPNRAFTPSAGHVTKYVSASGPGVRVDSALYDGTIIPQYYDSLIAKVATAGRTRAEAIARMRLALQEMSIQGVKTTISLHQSIMENQDFLRARFGTQWLDNYLPTWRNKSPISIEEAALVLVAIIEGQKSVNKPQQASVASNWKTGPSVESLRPALFAEV